MADSSLIVVDENIRDLGSDFQSAGKDLDIMISEYVSKMQSIRDTAILKGEAASSLDIYIGYASSLKGELNMLSARLNAKCQSFVKEIDDADQFLF